MRVATVMQVLMREENGVTLVDGMRAERICLAIPGPPGVPRYRSTCTPGFTYRDAMSVVKREMKHSELDITHKIDEGGHGGVIIRNLRSGRWEQSIATDQADGGYAQGLPRKVTMPRRTAELTVIGLEDWVTPKEVVAAIADEGGCHVDEINVRVIRAASRSLGSV